MSIPAFTAAPIKVQRPRSSSPPQPPPFNSALEAVTASWTSSIAEHCKNGRLSKAILELTRMRTSGIGPNHVTFVTLFSGCANFPSQGLFLGPSIHGYARKMGLDVGNVMVGTAVIDMYSKFGNLGLARFSFDHMGIRNKVSWNTIINGCMRKGEFDEAIKLFDEMPERDAISWTVLIDGFMKKKRFEEALEWFQEMQMLGMKPDFVTMLSVLSAVANLGALGLGLWLHRFILMQNFKDNIRVNNSLIDMHCKCGCVKFACQVFNNMPKRNLVSWNTVIVGLACNAHAEEALNYFLLMQKDGLKPDGVSFTGALMACSHAGLVDEGLKLFESMTQVYKITPRIEHYGCIVDLYSRSGRLKEALQVVKNMPMEPNEVVIGSLLAACRTCEDVKLAERLMHYVYNLDPNGDFNYVLLSNIFAAMGSWQGASKMRKKMKDLGVQKRPGISSIEVNGIIHEFMAGDKTHGDTESIYMMLNHLLHELRVSCHASEVEFQELIPF